MKLYVNQNKYSLSLFLELFILMPYQYIKIQSFVYDVTVYLKFIALAIELVVLFSRRSEKDDDLLNVGLVEIFFIMYILYMSLISLLRSSTSFTYNISLAVGLLLCLLSIRRNFYQDYECTIRTISLYFFIAIFANFMSIILYPDGLYMSRSSLGVEYQNYFLGLDNAFGMVVFPGATYCLYKSELYGKYKTIKAFVIFAMILIPYLITMSASGLIATIVYIVIYILYRLRLFKNILSFKVFIPLMVILSLVIITGDSILYTNSALSNYVASFLGKDLTFSGRTSIWIAGIAQFLQHPIIGYGVSASSGVVYFLGAYRIAHNFWLQILLEGGIVGTILYFIFMYSSNTKKNLGIQYNESLIIFDLGVCAMMVYMLMESGFASIPVSMLLLVMGYSGKLPEEYNDYVEDYDNE